MTKPTANSLPPTAYFRVHHLFQTPSLEKLLLSFPTRWQYPVLGKIPPPGAPGNVRNATLRTTESEPRSALAWVAPQESTRNRKMLLPVREAKNDGVWSLAELFVLADEWRVDYVIVSGPYEPAVEALFTAGRYSVIDVEEDDNDRPTGKGEEDRRGRLTKPTANSPPPTAYFLSPAA